MRTRAVIFAATFAVLAAPAAAAAQPQQFDLACKGAEQRGVDASKTEIATRYRIDLEAGRWCRDACAEGIEIIEVTPDKLVLERARDVDQWVDRDTGNVFVYAPSILYVFRGSCELAPFTGMPKPKF